MSKWILTTTFIMSLLTLNSYASPLTKDQISAFLYYTSFDNIEIDNGNDPKGDSVLRDFLKYYSWYYKNIVKTSPDIVISNSFDSPDSNILNEYGIERLIELQSKLSLIRTWIIKRHFESGNSYDIARAENYISIFNNSVRVDGLIDEDTFNIARNFIIDHPVSVPFYMYQTDGKGDFGQQLLAVAYGLLPYPTDDELADYLVGWQLETAMAAPRLPKHDALYGSRERYSITMMFDNDNYKDYLEEFNKRLMANPLDHGIVEK